MGSFTYSLRPVIILVVLVFLLAPVTHGLNLGLIAGDLKRHASPLVIKKISKLSPVFININSGSQLRSPLSFPKLPPKPPPLESTKPSRKVPRSILSPLPKLPILPILPILPPLLPIFPKLPLLPILPHVSIMPPLLQKLTCPLKPLQVPIIKRSPLETLKSELKLVKGPPLIPLKIDKKDSIQKKLYDLKKNGSLTTALKIVKSPPLSPLKIDQKYSIQKKLYDLKKNGSLTTAEYLKFKKLLLKLLPK